MIRWEPGVAGSATELSTASDASMIGRIVGLAEALVVLDGTDPETDSISFDKATDHLITIVRHVVTAARPVLDHPDALGAAVEEALADLRDVPSWCCDCERTESGVCGDHAEDLAQADVYAALLPAVTYRAEPGP